MMLHQPSVEVIRRIVTPEDFYRPAHQVIAALLLEMHSAGSPLDLVTVRGELERRKQLEAVGGMDYLVGLVEGTPSAGNAEFYARAVRDASLRRSLIVLGQEAAQNGYHSIDSAAEQLHAMQTRLIALERRASSTEESASDAAEGIGGVVQRIRTLQETGEHVNPPMPTGYMRMDNYTDGGARRGELIVIAGDTGSGKSTLAHNWAANWCRDGHAGLVWSTEMLDAECWGRFVANMAGIPYSCLRSGEVRLEEQWRELESLASAAAAWRMRVIGRPGTIGDVHYAVRTCANRWRRPLDFVVVDFLQDMLPEDRSAKRCEQVGGMARACKHLAQELQVAVVLVSQLNREGKGGRPTKRDLLDSGVIENSADCIVLLSPTEQDANMVELRYAKNRNGPATGWEPDLALVRRGPYFRLEQVQ
jgi:replicative DNA helicase